jgi:LuxR family transcriptional regulator, maltose regulon positive regulatory protein
VAKPSSESQLGRPLLAAKCAIPPSRPVSVVRNRLHEKLLSNATTRLTVVVAPAGWGKTTLLSQWAHDVAETRRIAWVSLDTADDDPTRFWTYALTALSAHGVGGTALEALGAPGVEPVDVALPLLLNEVKAAGPDLVLVLDDYHVLTDLRVHEGVEFLLSYLPPTLRLVIAGRADPPLPLPRLRAQGELTEVRMTDLSFSPAEAGELVTSVAAVELDGSALASLVGRTEGWAAGLQLAALTIKGHSVPSAEVDEIRGDNRHILDFFTSEVISRLRQAQRDLLVRTSGLERLSGPLCDAVLNRTGSANILAELDEANLFVVPLDDRREWYRVHRLFRDALGHQLEPRVSAEVLARAADWFYEEGFLDDAIALRIDAGAPQEAADLLRKAVPWFLEHGAGSILRLGNRLGTDALESDPSLCASLAWAAAVAGDFDQLGRWLDAAEPYATDDIDPPQGWHRLTGALSSLRGLHLLVRSEVAAALTNAARGVAAESDQTLPGYVLARHILGTSYVVDERPIQAVPVLEDAWERSRHSQFSPILGLQTACSLALALYQTGQYDGAQRVCDQSSTAVRTVQRAWGDAAALGIARLIEIQGRLRLRAGDVSEAQNLLRRAVTLSRVWGLPSQVVLALTGLAEAELAAGEVVRARAAVAEARELIAAEPVWRFAVRELENVDVRIGRGAVRAARRPQILVEDLTDRELTILRMLTGTANQREIGAALFLSINTVKGYAKSLYRKLDVTTRQEAVDRARALSIL